MVLRAPITSGLCPRQQPREASSLSYSDVTLCVARRAHSITIAPDLSSPSSSSLSFDRIVKFLNRDANCNLISSGHQTPLFNVTYLARDSELRRAQLCISHCVAPRCYIIIIIITPRYLKLRLVRAANVLQLRAEHNRGLRDTRAMQNYQMLRCKRDSHRARVRARNGLRVENISIIKFERALVHRS